MEKLYPENAWVTPCELFKPYYSYTVANYMLSQLDIRKNRAVKPTLKIMEIGPGTGDLVTFVKPKQLKMEDGRD